MKKDDKFKIDSTRVSQYENTRIVDVVTVIETPKKYQKKVLVHSPYLFADVLVFKNELIKP